MPLRALDHIVWPTRDLDALADTFRRLGFTVGRRNRHPWGTVNHIVQFDGRFLELLGFANDYRPLSPDEPAFPFAGFCADAIAASAGGAAMIVLRSDDAAADAASFRAQGLGPGRLLPFSRAAQGSDRTDRTVAFTIAFATLPGLPEIGAFTCQQHRPENFWNPALQRHANGVAGVGELVVEAPDVKAAAAALHAFAGTAAASMDHQRNVIRLSDCSIRVEPVKPSGSGEPSRACLTTLVFAVDDAGGLESSLAQGGVPYQAGPDGVRVAATVAGGTDLVFAPRP